MSALFTDDAAVHAERIAKVLKRKVWQHASPGAVDHARQILEREIANVIFHARISAIRAERTSRQEQS